MKSKDGNEAKNSGGFTSYANSNIKCPVLPDPEYRLKIVLEAHLGQHTNAIIMLKTLAKECGKHPRSIKRSLTKLVENSNLLMIRQGKIYKFSTKGDTGVIYGRTLTSRIRVHGCPTIKINREKEDFKKLGISSFKKSPILEDPDFKKALSLDRGVDREFRLFNHLIETLEAKYPAWKYEAYWKDANKKLFELRPTRAIVNEAKSKLK